MIRPATEADAARLPTIETLAAERFRDVGLDTLANRPPANEDAYAPFVRDGGLLVAVAADDCAVGFVAIGTVDDEGYIDEINVLPGFGKRGLGKGLVHAALEIARARRHRWVRLTTFRDVPWNAPWYRRLGFRDLDPARAGPNLQLILAHQQDLNRLSPRLAMELAL